MKNMKRALAAFLAVMIAAFSFMNVTAFAASAKDVTITKSDKTAKDPDGKNIHYLESMSFTLPAFQKEYYLYLYILSKICSVNKITRTCPDGCRRDSLRFKGRNVNMRKNNKAASLLLAVLALLALSVPAFAAVSPEPGTYAVDASLSCFVNAMGGVDFGKNLLKDVRVTVKNDGSAEATLYLTTDNITIYGMTVDTYVDAASSPIGYYDTKGVLQKDAAYTENDTLAEVKFVDSVTIPVTPGVDSVTLYVYINSSFMGVQFCDGSGTAGSGKPDTLTKYKGEVTFNWDTLRDGGEEIDFGETCPYCGKLHTGFFGRVQMFFHKFFIFIRNLFHK